MKKFAPVSPSSGAHTGICSIWPMFAFGCPMHPTAFYYFAVHFVAHVSMTLSVVKCVFMVSIRIGKSVASRTVTFALQNVLCA